jgi:hypothetical protein
LSLILRLSHGSQIRFENGATGELAETSLTAGSSLAVSGAGTKLSLTSCTLDAAVRQHALLLPLRLVLRPLCIRFSLVLLLPLL